MKIRISAATTVLAYTTDDVDISKEVLEQASTVVEGQELAGEIIMSGAFEHLIVVCLWQALPIPATERMKKLVMERSDAHRIGSLIQLHFDTAGIFHMEDNACRTEQELITLFVERMDKLGIMLRGSLLSRAYSYRYIHLTFPLPRWPF